MNKVALCLDADTLRAPSLVGLVDEDLEAQKWLLLYLRADQARRSIREGRDIVEAWVVGSDDVDPINLAAALKGDRPRLRVCLLAKDDSGSLLSRAYAASLDAVYNEMLFVRRYAAVKAALAYSHEARLLENDVAVASERHAASQPTAELPTAFAASGSGTAVDEFGFAGDFTATSGLREDTPTSAMDGRPEGVAALTGAMGASAPSSPALRLQTAASSPSVTKTAFLLTVVSGSGGAGKSTVSAVAALCAQLRGVRVALVDFDYQFGNVAGFFKDANPITVDELLRGRSVSGLSKPGDVQPVVISAPQNPEEAEVLAKRTVEVLDLLLPHFDVVVANTGATWTEQHAALLERSSKVLFLVDQRASSLQACHRALRLCERCGIPMGQFLFVANRCSKNSLLSSIDVSCALRGAEAVELRDGGRDVEDYSAAGLIVDLAVAENPLFESVDGVLGGLMRFPDTAAPASIPGKARRRGLFRRRDDE